MTGYVSTINPYGSWMSSAIGDGSLGFGSTPLGSFNDASAPMFSDFNTGSYPTTGSFGGSYPSYGKNVGYGKIDLYTPEGRRQYIRSQREMAQAQRALDAENTKSQIEQRKLAQTQQFKSEASDNQIRLILNNIHNAILHDDKDVASAQYANLVSVYTKQLELGNQETDINGNLQQSQEKIDVGQVKAQINALYQQNFGTSIADDIDKNCASEFAHGANIFNLIGLGDNKSSDDLKNQMCVINDKHKLEKAIGRGLPACAVGAAIGCAVGPIGSLIGAGIGLVVGGIVGSC